MPRGGKQRRSRSRRDEPEATIVDEGQVRRAVAAAAIGNTVEWFDFGVYSYIAVVIGQVFFPPTNPTAQLLSTFAAFAVAFLVRPLGGFFFGPLGDRIGRRTVLAITMVTMALGTVTIGLIPSYATIGIWAPVLLLVARLVQGFSTGGEYGGAATFVAEYSPDRRRGFMASWLELGTLTGYALGAGLVIALTVVLSPQDLVSWGWRIPFLLAGPLGIVGLYLRFRLGESPAYQAGSESEDEQAAATLRSLRTIFGDHWRAMLKCIGLVMVFNVTNYMLTAYMPTYLSAVLGFPHTGALALVLVAMVLVMGLIVVLGRFSDRIGRRPIAALGSAALIVLAFPAFLLIGAGSVPAVLAGLLVMGLILVCFSGTMPSTLPALFPTEVRYGAVSVGFNISVALFGGTTPLIAESLVAATGMRSVPAFLLVIAGAVGLVAVWAIREPAGRALPGSKPTATDRQEARQRAEEEREAD
ncbi:MFS transporter, MHS family, proline/betaine transporter [Saccharopolyspora kobensis]|uniref:Putative proline/betaine transporter n=1 Tax=Saccharopolyspora kobensis TaxID=146035 RepID=A0A1H5ZDP7_9PSEU|nr:MFS transporter [Saccharopolyspora kobensis]SEG34538.1 MFS transporter, MHS family, proline/betaine transporter [Saccharopolyspora kobensis]SFF17464.1 MFS transporter, MHS family, proline/betaine transporter [Saccharopolyspora kobensis]